MSGRMREIAKYRKFKTNWRMKPYCGESRAQKSPIRTCRTLGPCPSWHRPKGIAKMERRATLKALKSSTRQEARREIRFALYIYVAIQI